MCLYVKPISKGSRQCNRHYGCRRHPNVISCNNKKGIYDDCICSSHGEEKWTFLKRSFGTKFEKTKNYMG